MKTIVLVDDAATSSILVRTGYVVVNASTAVDGLNKFRSGSEIDLLITDFNMPDRDGIDFIKEVRKLPEYKFA